MASTFAFRVGEVRRISHVLESPEAFSVSAANITIYRPDGTTLIGANATCDFTATNAKSQEIWYIWNTASLSAGSYQYAFHYTVGSEVKSTPPARVEIIPEFTKLDPYVTRILSWLREQGAADVAELLTWEECMVALKRTVSHIDQYKPQELVLTYNAPGGAAPALVANQFEYSLPTSAVVASGQWTTGFSRVLWVEYPVDSTLRCPNILKVDEEIIVDTVRSVWRFLSATPVAATTGRFAYTAPHALTHTTDTLTTYTPQWFEPICQYAAGYALLMVASSEISTSAPTQGAQVVDFRGKPPMRMTLAQEMMRQAEMTMGIGEAFGSGYGTRVTWDYVPDHGRWLTR